MPEVHEIKAISILEDANEAYMYSGKPGSKVLKIDLPGDLPAFPVKF